MSRALLELAVLTIKSPREAAARILSLDLPSQVLWQGFALAVLLNALLFNVVQQISPARATSPYALPDSMQSPILATFILGGMLLLGVQVLLWAGRAADGDARMRDLLALVTWLQLLRFVTQLAVLILLFIFPMLAALLVMAALVWGTYILVSFVDVAHGFQSMAKAAFVIVGAVFALFVGLVLLISLFSIMALGA